MTREEIYAVVMKNIEQVVEGIAGTAILETESMRDLGVDSLEVVEVVSLSMKQLRIKIPRTDLTRAGNLGDLLDLFEKYAPAVPTRSVE